MFLTHIKWSAAHRILTTALVLLLRSHPAWAITEEETRLVERVSQEVVKTGLWPGADVAVEHSWSKDLREIEQQPQLKSYLAERVQAGLNSHSRQLGDPDQILPRAVVITHQTKKMQPATAKLLAEDSRFAGIPRIAMVSENFTIQDKEYADQISHYRFSQFGEVTKPLLAREVYLAGGIDMLCLARTTQDLIRHAANKGMPEITLRFQHEYVYAAMGMMPGTFPGSEPALHQIMKKPPSRSEGEISSIFAMTFLNKIETKYEPKSLKISDEKSNAVSMNFEANTGSNRIKVRIVIEDSPVTLPKPGAIEKGTFTPPAISFK